MTSEQHENGTDIDWECDSDQFQCKTYGQCIAEEFRCDLYVDCQDSSDELDCSDELRGGTGQASECKFCLKSLRM